MKWMLAVAGVVIAMLMLFLLQSGQPDSAKPPKRLPVRWTVDRRTAPEFTHPQEMIRQPIKPLRLPLVAAGLRTKGAAPLLAMLRDPSLSFESRCVVALVLGTINEPQAQQALLQELRAASDPRWISVLLHALGAEKTASDPEIFDLPDSPFVFEVAGLRLYIRTVVSDPDIRLTMASFLTHPDIEVRRAAARSLVHSTEFQDIRAHFTIMVKTETDDNIRAGYGHALATWLADRSADASDRDAVLDALLSAKDDDVVRFPIEQGLKRANLAEAELGRLIDIAERGTFHQQLWSLSILRERSEPIILPVMEQLAITAVEPKVREYAVSAVKSESILTAALSDSEWNVRVAAVRALAGNKNARAELERISASDSDERVREAARESLKR